MNNVKVAKELVKLAKELVAESPAKMKKDIAEVNEFLAKDLYSKPIWDRGIMRTLKQMNITNVTGLAYQGYDVYLVNHDGKSEMLTGADVRKFFYELLKSKGLIK